MISNSSQTTWLFLDFDNTLMGTEAHAVPSLIAYFNELYGDKIPTPLTLDTFKANWHGQARETLCKNMSDFYGIEVDYPTLYKNREWNMMRHYQNLDGGVPMASNMIDTLTGMADEGYKFAFVSNNPIQRALAAMRYASCGNGDKLARLFGSNFFEAGDVQKPKPDVYLRAMAQVGVTPANSYAVEDSASGTKSAVSAGMVTFGYTGFSNKPEDLAEMLTDAGCVAVFNDWTGFPALLQQQLNSSKAA